MPEGSIIPDVLLMVKGDQKAFERLYHKYWPKVYHFTSIYIDDEYEREEIVQKVFIRFWDARERLDPQKSPDGLLFIITRNLIFNQVHRSMNEKAMKEALALESPDVELSSDAEDLKAYVDNLVQALPARQREAFLLSREEGLSYREIAAKMKISEKGVERNLYLARKFLKEHLPLFLIFMRIFS